MSKSKKLEELKLDLIEVMAYRDLQDQDFCFDGKNIIKNDSECSEDVYYRILENEIINEIEECERDIKKKVKRI